MKIIENREKKNNKVNEDRKKEKAAREMTGLAHRQARPDQAHLLPYPLLLARLSHVPVLTDLSGQGPVSSAMMTSRWPPGTTAG